MKLPATALILALAACSTTPAENKPIARVVSGQTTTTEQANQLKNRNIGTGTVAETPGSATPEIDSTRRFEYVDVTVELGDPNGMRALVPYLMKPEIWTLIKCEMVDATSKHYRFQKVTSNEGRSLPDVDVFKTKR